MGEDLFDRRFLIVSGKGGTGKTTIACALAVAAARRGKTVLLVEVGRKEQIPPLFGRGDAGYREKKLAQGIYSMASDPYLALEEYLVTQLRVRSLVRAVLRNKLFQRLLGAAPGWRELITLGKVWFIAQRRARRSRRRHYDLFILDAPSTGHGLSFLRVPGIVLNTMRFGPVHRQIMKVHEFLSDPAQTRLCLVTLAEEMPVNETLELARESEKSLSIRCEEIFVNGVHEPVFTARERAWLARLSKRDEGSRLEAALGESRSVRAVLRVAQAHANRCELQGRYLEILGRKLDHLLVRIPFYYQADFGPREIEAIADLIEKQIGSGAKA